SIDSEGNTTPVLIARLLARFEALTQFMSSQTDDPAAAMAALRLRSGLRTTFWLKKDPPDDIFRNKETRDANLTSLSQNYYLINDWICSAFESLIEHLARWKGRPPDLALTVNTLENELLSHYDKSKVPLSPIELGWLID